LPLGTPIFDAELRVIVDAWDRLPEPICKGILAMVNAAAPLSAEASDGT